MEWKITYEVHLLGEWVAQHLADMAYQPEDMPPIDLQLPPKLWMPYETSRHGSEEDAKEGVKLSSKEDVYPINDQGSD